MKNIPYYRKKMIYGFLFITPWLIGFILFFLTPFLQSCSYAFQTLTATPEGMVGEWIGLENFRFALFRDTDFLVECANSLKDLITVPLILVYSICFALLLKKEYPGRTLMRAIAFLPVIIGSGVLMDILKQDVFATTAGGAGESMAIFSSTGLSGLFTAMGLPENIVNLINELISKIFDLTWRSGVQILLFLAGLHNIPDYVYEAAEIEGANPLQVFISAFKGGNLAMTCEYGFNAITAYACDYEIEWAPLPTGPSGEKYDCGGALNGFVIPVSAANPEGAAVFARMAYELQHAHNNGQLVEKYGQERVDLMNELAAHIKFSPIGIEKYWDANWTIFSGLTDGTPVSTFAQTASEQIAEGVAITLEQ